MLVVMASGNLGRDAEMRTAGRDQVCSFSIACSKKVKGQDTVVWLGCNIWGARGEKLVQHLRKGTKVVVTGELTTREHQGKTYLDCRVSELDFAGGAKRTGGPPADDSGDGPRTGFDGGNTPADEEIPF